MIRLPRTASALVLACAMACGPSSGQQRGAQDLPANVDSIALASSGDTTFQRRLADLVRRASLVPMDSTARLVAAIPKTADSGLHVIRQALGCEGMILVRQHGAAAWQRAQKRLTDSLVKAGFDYETQMQRMEAAPGPPLEFNGPDSCGENRFGPPPADSLTREPNPAMKR